MVTCLSIKTSFFFKNKIFLNYTENNPFQFCVNNKQWTKETSLLWLSMFCWDFALSLHGVWIHHLPPLLAAKISASLG